MNTTIQIALMERHLENLYQQDIITLSQMDEIKCTMLSYIHAQHSA